MVFLSSIYSFFLYRRLSEVVPILQKRLKYVLAHFLAYNSVAMQRL